MPRPTPLVLALVAVALTACSPGAPTDHTHSTGAEAGPALSLDELRKTPCTGLTADQLTGLGLAPGTSISDVGYGASCMWSMPEHRSNVAQLSFETFDGRGFDAIRDNRAEHAYYEEVLVESYPAAFASSFDQRPEGSCTLRIDAADELVMTLTTTLPEGPDAADPCPAAQRIATAVVRNLRAT